MADLARTKDPRRRWIPHGGSWLHRRARKGTGTKNVKKESKEEIVQID